MNQIEKQIIDTWLINHRTNLMLINALTEDGLSLTTSKRGGGSVGHQLAHIYNIRYWKLEKYDKSLVKDLTSIKASDPKYPNVKRLSYHNERPHSSNVNSRY